MLCWCVLVCVGLCWCVLVSVGVCWRMMAHVGVRWRVLACVGVCWRVLACGLLYTCDGAEELTRVDLGSMGGGAHTTCGQWV